MYDVSPLRGAAWEGRRRSKILKNVGEKRRKDQSKILVSYQDMTNIGYVSLINGSK